MTEEKNCELLFEYLRSILYDSKIQKLDPESLDEPYQKLGYGLCFLQRAIEEMLTYSADLSQGNLSGFYPSADNFLCVNLKNLHANLNHLTWQAKQVASGDYSQHVSYLGEFSQAFNTMTAKLAAREGELTDKAYLDPGTGIHNRLFFEERMSLVLEQKKHVRHTDKIHFNNIFHLSQCIKNTTSTCNQHEKISVLKNNLFLHHI